MDLTEADAMQATLTELAGCYGTDKDTAAGRAAPLESEIERLAGELTDQKQYYGGLLSQLWQTIIDFRRDRARLTAQIEALRLQAESADSDFRRDRAMLTAQIEALRLQAESADAARRAAEAAQVHAREAHTQAATILHALYKSTSWRVTRPIRGLKKLLAGQKLR